MRGRKSADMALGNGSANRQQRWGNGKGTNCTAEHVLSHSSGYYYIIVLYISLSCTYHCLVCSPHSAKRMQVVTTHVHVSQTRQLTVRHSRLCCPHGDVCVRKTVRLECQVLRESKREMWLMSSHAMSSRFTRLVHGGPTFIGRTPVQRACALYVGRARRTANRDDWVGRLA
jgi:hypothetical protein